ncbi:MAG: hypothetical protein N3A38_02285 [Planctomycetota bacterium]|nr:hypothetical protein [Planctomycetota bacterium]
MRVGSVDISWRAAAFAAAILAAAIVDLKLFFDGSRKRAEGFLGERAWRATLDGSPSGMAAAAEYAGKLVEIRPESFEVRWLQAGALLAAGDHAEAERAYAKMLDMPGLTRRQKAMAWVGRGGAAFAGASGRNIEKGRKTAREAFEKALAEDPSCAEASANLGLLLLHEEDDTASAERAVKLLEGAAACPPGREAARQVYNGLAVALARVGRVSEADRYFQMAMDASPKWQVPVENRKVTAVASLPDPNVDDKARLEMLERLEAKWPRFGAYEVRALNAAGVGWHLRRKAVGPEEYAAAAAPKAVRYLTKAWEMKPGDSDAAMNLIAVYEQLFADALEQNRISAPDMAADAGPAGPFGRPASEDGAGSAPVLDAKAASKLGALLTQMETQFSKLYRTRETDKKLRVELALRIALCHRWRAALGLAPRGASLEAALAVLGEAAAIAPDDPRLLRASAHIKCVLGKYAEAAGELKKYREAGAIAGEDQKALDAMMEAIGRPPDILWIRPVGGRWWGSRPVLSASIAVRSCPIPPREADCSVTINGAAAQHRLVGTEIVCLSGPEDLKGEAAIKFAAKDALGNSVERQVVLSPDGEPPVLSCSPGDGAMVDGPRPAFEFSISDAGSGVDFKSVNLKLTSASDAPAVNLSVIVAGRYKFKFGETGSEMLMTEKFRISPPVDLAKGKYKWTLQASDASGNTSSLEAGFEVR